MSCSPAAGGGGGGGTGGGGGGSGSDGTSSDIGGGGGGGGRGDDGEGTGEGVSSEVSSKESSEVYPVAKATNSPSDMGDKGSWESSDNGLGIGEGTSRTG